MHPVFRHVPPSFPISTKATDNPLLTAASAIIIPLPLPTTMTSKRFMY
jgi:hypothetical protein